MLYAGKGLRCPMCDSGAAFPTALDALVLELIRDHALSENAESALRAAYVARGLPVLAEVFFDWMYEYDPEGGPTASNAYRELKEALAELARIRPGMIVDCGKGKGWRFSLAIMPDAA